MKTFKQYSILSILMLSAMLLVQCGEPDYPTPVPVVTSSTSKLTVIHALAGGPRIKVKMDNKITEKDTLRYEKAGDGKFYNSITLAVPAGPNRLINYANFEDNTNFVTDRYNATIGTNNTSFFINTRSGAVVSKKVRRVTDDLATPDVGYAKVRFLHFAFDVAEVKVTDVGGTTTIFSARKYDEVSRGSGASAVDFTRFSSIVAGTYNLEVRLTSDNSLLLELPNVKLDSKGIYTIYAKGVLDGVDANAVGYAIFKH